MDEAESEININNGICLNNCEEGGRGCRNKKKQTDPVFCPVCSVTLRNSEVESHVNTEVEKLNKLPSNKHRSVLRNAPSTSTGGTAENTSNKNWETFQKIKINRQNRQKQKSRKRKNEEVICPVCNKETTEDIQSHVEMCIRQSENENVDSDENIDVEGYEEYEWAGESRVRTTTLLPGGAASLGTTVSMVEDDEDLTVDVDNDTQMYGASQYSESDIIFPCGDAFENALRKAVTGSDQPKRLLLEEVEEINSDINGASEGDPIVEVLKGRIRELEKREQNKEVYKCLICMDRYRTPVISICCWHVHCERCWLQTLGVKKLCPQCNMITSPSDLRKIFM